MAKFLPVLFYSQLFVKIPELHSDFSDQTVIVTGSNTGLGLEAARHLVRLKAAKVILAVRTISKGEAAVENILRTTGAKKNTIEVWQLDLSSPESIKAFAKRASDLDRLDAVIQNAGVLTQNWSIAEETKTESHIAVNLIGALLLGLLLLPKLRETGKKYDTRTRLSFVGSDIMYIAKIKEANVPGSLLDALNDKEGSDLGDRYGVSKQLLFYAVHEIAARSPVSPESNVIINVMTPGACESDLFRDDISWIGKLVQRIAITLFARTTEVGGRTLVDAVKPELGTDAHGAFLMDCKVARNGSNMETTQGLALQKRSNEDLFAKLEELSPGVTKVLN
ncbi:NAD(P)-binding protein [Lophiostoma macrostomum CBS 122681]|uniref:NAD(P)-binding protein n=1 Tax=Lophiostoma macrostomum CBS 122681 TaxID=1314788 RepID=A0A6A6T872_9PLEO|nr:NAD(P)-binding protein [Lophiostoma macrostomum CBS 122681]